LEYVRDMFMMKCPQIEDQRLGLKEIYTCNTTGRVLQRALRRWNTHPNVAGNSLGNKNLRLQANAVEKIGEIEPAAALVQAP
jgi:hypothetical protein